MDDLSMYLWAARYKGGLLTVEQHVRLLVRLREFELKHPEYKWDMSPTEVVGKPWPKLPKWEELRGAYRKDVPYMLYAYCERCGAKEPFLESKTGHRNALPDGWTKTRRRCLKAEDEQTTLCETCTSWYQEGMRRVERIRERKRYERKLQSNQKRR
jgi:hypothetical protein